MRALLAFGSFMFLAWAAVPQSRDEKPRSGAQLFSAYCGKCHTLDGANAMGPTLRHIFQSKKLNEKGFRGIVMNGKNTMPPFRGRLNDKELDRLVAYLRTK